MLLFCASGAVLSLLPLKGTKIGFCDFVRNGITGARISKLLLCAITRARMKELLLCAVLYITAMRNAVKNRHNALCMRKIKARKLNRAVLDKVHEMPQLMRHGRQRLNRVGRGMPVGIEFYRGESVIIKALDIKALKVETVAVVAAHAAGAQAERHVSRARNGIERYNALLAAYLSASGTVAYL